MASMHAHDGTLIRVLAEWNGWRTAEVRLRDFLSVHWLQPGQAPQPLLHGTIACTNVVTGDIPHNCERASAPHRLLVCILERHNIPAAFAELARRSDQPRTLPPGRRAVSAATSEKRMSGSIPARLL